MGKAKEGDNRLGNQFWKIRSKHGRNKLFATSKLMWEAAAEYFEWCDEHKWERIETTKKPGGVDIKTIPTERPYTLSGLCIYLGCNTQYFNQFKKGLPKGEKDFSLIITRIEEIIYTHKFEGAAVGAFNSNIMARELGLTDKAEIKQNTTVEYINVSKQFPDE